MKPLQQAGAPPGDMTAPQGQVQHDNGKENPTGKCHPTTPNGSRPKGPASVQSLFFFLGSHLFCALGQIVIHFGTVPQSVLALLVHPRPLRRDPGKCFDADHLPLPAPSSTYLHHPRLTRPPSSFLVSLHHLSRFSPPPPSCPATQSENPVHRYIVAVPCFHASSSLPGSCRLDLTNLSYSGESSNLARLLSGHPLCLSFPICVRRNKDDKSAPFLSAPVIPRGLLDLISCLCSSPSPPQTPPVSQVIQVSASRKPHRRFEPSLRIPFLPTHPRSTRGLNVHAIVASDPWIRSHTPQPVVREHGA